MSVSAGSSPLARGTRGFSRATAGGGGLIPARAGNTEWLTDWLQTGEAHPRSRGEHLPSVTEQKLHRGSSPLARGTLEDLFMVDGLDGLIPARAGNTVICWNRR